MYSCHGPPLCSLALLSPFLSKLFKAFTVPFLLPIPGSLAWDFSLCLCLSAGVVGCEWLVNSENLNPWQVTLSSYSFNSCAARSTYPSTPSHTLFWAQREHGSVVTLMCGTWCFYFIALIVTSVKFLILQRVCCLFLHTDIILQGISRCSPRQAYDYKTFSKHIC